MNLLKLTQENKNLLAKLNANFNENLSGEYVNGDIIATNISKKYRYLLRRPSKEVALMRKYITNVGHGGVVFKSSDDTGAQIPKISQIIGVYSNNQILDMESIISSEVWRMEPHKLINMNQASSKIFQKICNQNMISMEDYTSQIFQDVSQSIHVNKPTSKSNKFQVLRNDTKRRYAAGRADYFLEGGHRRKIDRKDKFYNIHAKYFKEKAVDHPSSKSIKGEEKKKLTICSEFVTKSNIAALIETDIRITNLIVDYSENNPDDLEAAEWVKNYNTRTEDSLQLIELPYDTKERLKRVHPGRMIKLLQNKNCITKVPPPAILNSFFQSKELK